MKNQGMGRVIVGAAAAALSALLTWVPASTEAADAGYVLKPGDSIVITVFQEDDLTTETRLPRSGEIEFPLVGTIKLAGRTVKEAVADLTARLSQGLVVDPKVTLIVTGSAAEQATVMGQVHRPGLIEIPGDARLDILTAIAMAGGYTDRADPGRVVVRRQREGENRSLRIDTGRMAEDPSVKSFFLDPGDIVIVGEFEPHRVTVMGEVERPGVIELPRKGRFDLLAVIAEAGGYTDIANPKRVSVRRRVGDEVRVFTVDARRLADDPSAAPFHLEPNDVITVSESFF